MHIIYTPHIEDDAHMLDPEESRHCLKVLRMKTGDAALAVDGTGTLYEGKITVMDTRHCLFEVTSKQQNYQPLPYRLTLAIAPTKSMDRFEWFLEKATEIGVSRIIPILCEHSERRRVRTDRMERVVIAAMKQSVKAFKPEICEPMAMQDWLSHDDADTGLIAHCMESDKMSLWKTPLMKKISIAIGPEGDFTREEVHKAVSAGFKEVSLGDYRLRNGTAGFVACTAVYSRHL